MSEEFPKDCDCCNKITALLNHNQDQDGNPVLMFWKDWLTVLKAYTDSYLQMTSSVPAVVRPRELVCVSLRAQRCHDGHEPGCTAELHLVFRVGYFSVSIDRDNTKIIYPQFPIPRELAGELTRARSEPDVWSQHAWLLNRFWEESYRSGSRRLKTVQVALAIWRAELEPGQLDLLQQERPAPSPPSLSEQADEWVTDIAYDHNFDEFMDLLPGLRRTNPELWPYVVGRIREMGHNEMLWELATFKDTDTAKPGNDVVPARPCRRVRLIGEEGDAVS